MTEIKLLSPKEAAKQLGIATITLQRWEKAKKIQVVYTPNGRRRIPLSEINRIIGKPQQDCRCYIYVRVNSKKYVLNGDLEKQKQRLSHEAENRNYKIIKIIEEIGSGLKENRISLLKLLELANQKKFDILLVEHQNIIMPFGLSYLEKQFSLLGIKIDILENQQSSPSIKENIKNMLSVIMKLLNLLNLKEQSENFIKIKWKLYQIIKIIK